VTGPLEGLFVDWYGTLDPGRVGVTTLKLSVEVMCRDIASPSVATVEPPYPGGGRLRRLAKRRGGVALGY
jgi:hypothetical protein